MNILVINCGSSSLKYQLINSESEEVLAKGLCERIGIDGSCITHQPKGGEKVKTEIAMPTHTQAVAAVIEKLTDEKVGVVKSLAEIDAVGHRIVHGGEKFASSVVIDAVYMSVSDPSCFTISRLIRTLRKCRYLIPSAWHIMSFLRRVTLRPCTLVHLIILPVHFLDAVLQQIIMHDVWNKQYKQCNKQDHKPRLKRKYQCKKSSKC